MVRHNDYVCELIWIYPILKCSFEFPPILKFSKRGDIRDALVLSSLNSNTLLGAVLRIPIGDGPRVPTSGVSDGEPLFEDCRGSGAIAAAAFCIFSESSEIPLRPRGTISRSV